MLLLPAALVVPAGWLDSRESGAAAFSFPPDADPSDFPARDGPFPGRSRLLHGNLPEMTAQVSTLPGLARPFPGSPSATAAASGPVFQILSNAWQGGGFPVARRSLTQPAWRHEVAPTFATMGANNEATQAEIDAFRTGFQRTLPAIDRELAARVFADSLPLAGNQLAVSAA